MRYIITLLTCSLFVCTLSCATINNEIPEKPEGYLLSTFTADDGTRIYEYIYSPIIEAEKTIYIIAGITGINHVSEKDLIQALANGKNRIVVIHPRGTGYSEGSRGRIKECNKILDDYVEMINRDKYSGSKFLFGHSMSAAFVVSIANRISHLDGVILVNPPVMMKKAKGMTPTLFEYIKYAFYLVFRPNASIVNMAGNPAIIENEADRKEAEARNNDPLLVKYFSMHMMLESKKIMDSIITNAKMINIPLLLIYGTHDGIVDEKGCIALFEAWKNPEKEYFRVTNGPHGKRTAIQAIPKIQEWIEDRKAKTQGPPCRFLKVNPGNE